MRTKTDGKIELILKEDVAGLGYKYDSVRVKPGYGRNYLIPRGVAVIANDSNKKMVAELQKQIAHKAEKIKTEALNMAASIAELTIEIKAKVGESGRIFGRVTTLQLADALKEKGFAIDRKKISFDEEAIKTPGEYEALIDLHKEVKHTLKFAVVAD